MTISRWFWSSGFGPGPSGGIGVTLSNGFAGPGDQEGEEGAHREHGRPGPAALVGVLAPVGEGEREDVHAEDAPQKRIEPSSALHSDTTVYTSGVARLPTCAT